MKRLVKRFFTLCTVILSFVLFPGCSSARTEKEQANAPKKLDVGLFVDFGSKGNGSLRWALLLQNSPDVELHLLDGKDLGKGELNALDLLVMPGGNSTTQWKSILSANGGEKLKAYVRDGGKYFGTCAGMALVLNERHRFPMLPFHSALGKTPGGMAARIALTKEASEQFGVPEDVMVPYLNGPIVVPGPIIGGASCEVLGCFNCEFSQNGLIKVPMDQTPAILRGRYGEGELFVTNCHPELTTSTHPIVIGGIKMLTGRTIRLVYPQKRRGAIRVGFFSTGIGGKKPIRDLFALDVRPDVDVVPVSRDDVKAGILEHLDCLFVTDKAFPDDEKLFVRPIEGKEIRAFVKRGGRIIRSVGDVR